MIEEFWNGVDWVDVYFVGFVVSDGEVVEGDFGFDVESFGVFV